MPSDAGQAEDEQPDEPPVVAGLAGSLRDGSHTRTACQVALDGAEERGARTDFVDLQALDLPPFDPDRRDAGDAPGLKDRVTAADALVLATPMYHGSYSSVLKTALDYCGFDEVEATTIGLLAVAGGGFPITALDHLRSVCRALDAWVLPYQAAVPNAHEAFADGELADPDLADRVARLGHRTAEYARIEPDPRCFEAAANVGGD
jgi:NAD(P)H-dependent FMN reductase